MAIWYLDNDDEITDAVARLRGTDAGHVVFVVPPDSRIATGRINFKLLAREAAARGLAMAVASPDEQVRALATSAGVIAAATPDQAQAALERGDEPPDPTPAVAEPRDTAALGAPSPDRWALRWRSRRLRVVTVVMLALVVVGGYLTTEALPTAEVRLVPRLASVGPLEVAVVASVETTELDLERGAIPAVSLGIPLEAEDVYASSGSQTSETRAQGTVVFSALEQEFDQEIAAGTRVQTPAGVAFQTTETVTLPRTDGSESTVAAPVEALAAGPDGNVPAETISVVPSLESQGIAVTNPEPTSDGRSEATPLVTAADYDAAAVDLRNRLSGELAAYLRDSIDAPDGLTVYPGSAVLGPVTLQPAPDEIIGRAADDFVLSGSADAGVLAVDETVVDQVVRAHLSSAVPEDLALVQGTIEVEHGEGVADSASVAFSGRASGQATVVIDPEALLERIAGLPVSQAQAILEPLGTATVTVWPGFVGDLPDDRQRITLDVSEASDTE